MSRRSTCGVIVGALVGALPFWLVTLVRNGDVWPGCLAFAVAVILSAAAFRAPAAWAFGVVAGAVLSWAALAVLAGTDWRLLPYVLVGSYVYYIGATAVVFGGYAVSSSRTRSGRSPHPMPRG